MASGEVSDSVSKIAISISNEIERQVDTRVRKILEDGGKDEWIAFMKAEVEHYRQRCEELEIELECLTNAFPNDNDSINPKRRGMW